MNQMPVWEQVLIAVVTVLVVLWFRPGLKAALEQSRRGEGNLTWEQRFLASYDFAAQRLFVDTALSRDAVVNLDRSQANYLLNVLRLKTGAAVLVFNGRDGEWRARVEAEGRRGASLVLVEQVRAQTPAPDLAYLFAPLKHARLDYMVQKAVEMGAGCLAPVFTERSQAARVNAERMRANPIEAAEQCGVLSLPEIRQATSLTAAIQGLEPDRLLVFCDEDAPPGRPVEMLASLADQPRTALLIGPEGGFSPAERKLIFSRSPILRLSLGPRILRSDTAAVAALAILQGTIGDWR